MESSFLYLYPACCVILLVGLLILVWQNRTLVNQVIRLAEAVSHAHFVAANPIVGALEKQYQGRIELEKTKGQTNAERTAREILKLKAARRKVSQDAQIPIVGPARIHRETMTLRDWQPKVIQSPGPLSQIFPKEPVTTNG